MKPLVILRSPALRDDEGSLYLLDSSNAGILLPRLRDQNDSDAHFNFNPLKKTPDGFNSS